MTSAPATLRLRLTPGHRGLEVRITPPVEPPLAALLRGKDPDTAATLVGRLFNICGAAQEAAARSALGLPLDPSLEKRVAAETLREHGVKLFLLWPGLLNIEPDRAAPTLLARALEDETMAAALWVSLFGPKGTPPTTWSAFERWVDEAGSVPARCMKAVWTTWDPAWGRADLPNLDSLAGWPGPPNLEAPRDTGVGGRVADHPLMAAIADRLGRGALWRMTARLVEMKRLLSGTAPSPFRAPGVVEAARGTLFTRATTDDAGRVASLERLTPTDFALAPGGALEMALSSLPPDAPNLEALARLVVDVIDPCLAVELTVDGAPGHA
ncbi:MAG: hypothetical protein K9H25_20795 [Rhodospirillum sp.]|nr:hypothetical protein [Rhodospirillum sp.]MCF8490997.1 hypothetical protein [Rhodospirillum sp.]MCF8499484.1 hypothetical protein [Rhodospirillum sp.]